MLVLLPPSETKAAPARRGRPADLASLSFPSLSAHRERVLEALIATSGRPDAVARLEAGPSLAAEVERNLRIRLLPARPASEIYTGVLFDALGFGTLSPAARRRANREVVVISALWGALHLNDRVPPYRLSMGTSLEDVGPLATAWREHLAEAFAQRFATPSGRRALIVDCRSAPYAAAFPLTGDLGRRSVQVRVLREEEGRRTVVSHMAKHTRGLVVRHLLESGADPRTPAQFADALASEWKVELVEPERPGRPWTADVVVPGAGVHGKESA